MVLCLAMESSCIFVVYLIGLLLLTECHNCFEIPKFYKFIISVKCLEYFEGVINDF